MLNPNIDVNVTNARDGQTALSIYCADNLQDLVKMLVKHPGVQFDVKNNKGENAFAVASKGCKELLNKSGKELEELSRTLVVVDGKLWGAASVFLDQLIGNLFLDLTVYSSSSVCDIACSTFCTCLTLLR